MRRGAPAAAWQPLLTGERRDRAVGIVAEIASDLRARLGSPAAEAEDLGWALADGRSGIALLFAYLGQALDDDDARQTALGLVQEALEAAAASAKTTSLFEGLPGVAWVVAHLDGWLFDLADADPNETVDGAVLDVVLAWPPEAPYDLMSGLVGIGAYALERLPRTKAAACLGAVVDRLAALAEHGPSGAGWFTPPDRLFSPTRAEYPQGGYCLGVAHGSAGVIALLGKSAGAGLPDTSARPLLSEAHAWLMAQRLPLGLGGSFSAWVGPGVAAGAARSAWCYGDPGMAAALLVAARHAGVVAWQAEALAIAERTAVRPFEDCRVVDACLCHGSAGLAHLFNRMYQSTGSPVLREAALSWFGRVLDDYQPGSGIGGFKVLQPDGTRWAGPGFLMGAAGIGLALLAAATPVEPRWDRVLLLS